MHTAIKPRDRVAELKDELKEKERGLQELKTERDEARDLVERMREHVEDANALIESWTEAFDMTQGDDGKYTFANWRDTIDEAWKLYDNILKRWNKFVPECNEAMAAQRRERNVGRPLEASDAQRETVLKLRERGLSLRLIAEETSLGLNTVRTIVDQRDRRDRTSVRYLERIQPDMGKARELQSRKRVRDALPRRINALQEQSAELIKEAKGLA